VVISFPVSDHLKIIVVISFPVSDHLKIIVMISFPVSNHLKIIVVMSFSVSDLRKIIVVVSFSVSASSDKPDDDYRKIQPLKISMMIIIPVSVLYICIKDGMKTGVKLDGIV